MSARAIAIHEYEMRGERRANLEIKSECPALPCSGKTDVDGEVKRLVLGYMNGIQAIYMLPSLGRRMASNVLRKL